MSIQQDFDKKVLSELLLTMLDNVNYVMRVINNERVVPPSLVGEQQRLAVTVPLESARGAISNCLRECGISEKELKQHG